jgi:hypothetical protein
MAGVLLLMMTGVGASPVLFLDAPVTLFADVIPFSTAATKLATPPHRVGASDATLTITPPIDTSIGCRIQNQPFRFGASAIVFSTAFYRDGARKLVLTLFIQIDTSIINRHQTFRTNTGS